MLLGHFKFSFKDDKLNFRFIGTLTINIFRIMQVYIKREPKSYKPASFFFGFPAD